LLCAAIATPRAAAAAGASAGLEPLLSPTDCPHRPQFFLGLRNTPEVFFWSVVYYFGESMFGAFFSLRQIFDCFPLVDETSPKAFLVYETSRGYAPLVVFLADIVEAHVA
jgi:hypothetical protein